MNQRTCSFALVCLLLFAVIGSANAEVIRCVDSAGSISFTNSQCAYESRDAQAPVLKAVPVIGMINFQKDKFAAAEKARTITAFNNMTDRRSLSIDQMTVHGAKASTDSMDIESDLARQQASAERLARENRWAF
ncbi:hypothetical protein Q8A64_03200 [Oxalobacteraceae bacterium R-40]|uniref:DUF4124 domain-containing protein n=1 Tax=Keguizhuia sedimenti TaxID=3064264 RepID=A0ABU1BK91_9BURK|nr:hypothetical protein [Oxalobacteraceae bacterium R-40]